MHSVWGIYGMPANMQPTFLLASRESALLEAMEPVLGASGARVVIVLSAEAALLAMTSPQPPSLALLDAELPDMETGQLLTEARASAGGQRFPIVLLTDEADETRAQWLTEGLLDDLVPRAPDSAHWRMRLDMVLRTWLRMRELERLREAFALNAQFDGLTGVYNRGTLLSMLFRETDRAQRLRNSLCLLLFDIDDFGHWNARLDHGVCDELLCQSVERTTRVLRSYDLLGRAGKDEFLAVLPGCDTANAVLLAERLRSAVFAAPFHVAGESVRLSACFGIASSEGRAPVVVLREAEQALQKAKDTGPESIQCFSNDAPTLAGPVAFLSPSSGDELLAW